MPIVKVAARVPIGPEAAVTLWSDPGRWPMFVDGFKWLGPQGRGWPEEGGKVVWESEGRRRGRVTEKVVSSTPTSFASQVYEERLIGLQTFHALEDEAGSRIELSLEYELTRGGPLRGLNDRLFMRRALGDALARTLRRFAVQAERLR
jgi:hypothetical protein